MLLFCYIQVDGAWSAWEGWGQCDVTCGSGSRARTRRCDAPPPQHGGDDCPGDAVQTTTCDMNTCPGIQLQVVCHLDIIVYDYTWSMWV